YYGNQNKLEHDFIVGPHRDPNTIRMQIRGASSLTVNDAGSLEMRTPAGVVAQDKPVAYQVINGKREKVLARYRLLGKQQVGFQVAGYDETKPLVIDPVLRYST